MKVIVNVQRLNQVLAEKGLTANLFAKQSPISMPTAYRVIKGNYSPTPRIAKIIAESLGVPFEEIFTVEV
jgi:predicted transcriptional regulator